MYSLASFYKFYKKYNATAATWEPEIESPKSDDVLLKAIYIYASKSVNFNEVRIWLYDATRERYFPLIPEDMMVGHSFVAELEKNWPKDYTLNIHVASQLAATFLYVTVEYELYPEKKKGWW